jgi:hypothetical protein
MGENNGGVKIAMPDGSAVDQPSWMASLPDAHKMNPNFAQFKEAPLVWDKFDSFLKAEGSTVAIPGEGASDQDRATFYTRLGKPESSDKYEVGKPQEWPDGIPYEPEGEKWFRDVAMKHNLTNAQAKGLFADYMDMTKGRISGVMEEQQKATQLAEQKRVETREKSIGELKKEWIGDTYAANISLAERAAARFGGEDIKKFFSETPGPDGGLLGDYVPLVKVFATIGEALGEDTLKGGPVITHTPAASRGGFQYKTQDYGGPK